MSAIPLAVVFVGGVPVFDLNKQVTRADAFRKLPSQFGRTGLELSDVDVMDAYAKLGEFCQRLLFLHWGELPSMIAGVLCCGLDRLPSAIGKGLPEAS